MIDVSLCDSCFNDVVDGEPLCISCELDDQSAGLRTLAQYKGCSLNWPGKLVVFTEPPLFSWRFYCVQIVVPIPFSSLSLESGDLIPTVCARKITLEGRMWTSRAGRSVYVYARTNAYFAHFTQMMRELGVVGNFRY